MHREWVNNNTKLPVEVTILAGEGSGECLERSQYLRLINLVESREYDLVLTEDFSRIVRRIHAHLFAELCVDCGVRLIATNDHVDTEEDGWQDRSIFSAWHHERSNRDTSERIKRTHRNRFVQGGALSHLIYGYRKKPGAKSDDDVIKLLEAEAIYKEWFERLDRGELYSQVADWLNEKRVPTGPNCRKRKVWDGPMVGRVTHNPILKGVRFRNKRVSKRHNASGKFKSCKADPGDLLIRRVPHLAFFEEPYYDRVIAKADAANVRYRRNNKGGSDPCVNRPKKRVRFPGQILDCDVCGRQYVFGGHGQRDHLMCDGARQHKCWNGVAVDGPLATNRISEVVSSAIEALKDFDPSFLSMVSEEARRFDSGLEDHLNELARNIDRMSREIVCLVKFIADGDESQSVREELLRLERERDQLNYDRGQLEHSAGQKLTLPSIHEIKQIARAAFADLATDCHEYAQKLRAVTGRISVHPFRSIDGGHPVLRGKFTLRLTEIFADIRLQNVLQPHFEQIVTVDLFEPPQRLRYREAVIEGRRTVTEREVADKLGITHTAAQRAARLGRLMKERGIQDPFVLSTEPPADYEKLRRHLHPRYHFEPLPGHESKW